MNVLVLLVSLAFVLLGIFILVSGKEPMVGLGAILFFGGGAIIAAWDIFSNRRSVYRDNTVGGHWNEFRTPIEIKSSRLHFLAYFLGAAGFAGAGALMVVINPFHFVGWLAVAFFGPGSLLFLWHLLDPRPRVVIDEEGIFDRKLGLGCIPWSEIRQAYLGSVQGNDFICLELFDPSRYLNVLSPVRRMFAGWSRGMGFTEITVSLSGVAKSSEEVLRIVHWHLKREADRHQHAILKHGY